MADEETKKCLNDWGFGDLVHLFSEQEITYNCLKSLSSDLIKELIPVIGRRVKFLEQWRTTFGSTQRVIQSEAVLDVSATLNESTETATYNRSQSESNFDLKEGSSTSCIKTHERILNKKRTYTGESEYRKRLKNIGGDYLDDLLKKNNLADPLLADFKRNNRLSNKSSFLLCDCIANDLVINKYSKFTTQDYIDLTGQIKKWFPTENLATYFRPGIPKKLTKNKKSKKPGGRLYDKIKNRKSLFARLTGTIRHRDQSEDTDEDETEPLAEDVAESLVWLDHNRDFTQIDHHWKITAEARNNILVKTNGNVSSYLTKYPVLKDINHGFRLVNIDFDELYTTSASKFYEHWECFITKVFDLTIRKKKNHTHDVQALLKIIDDENSNLYAKRFAEILLLPFAIPPRAGVSIIKQEYWKPSILESQQGFAVHAKDAGDIDKIHKEKVALMHRKNTTVQPYILGIGNNLKDVNSFMVILDKPLYRFDSPLTALATCFKIFFVWNVQFPLQSKQIWTLLQHGIFKFTTDNDEEITHVSKLLELINALS